MQISDNEDLSDDNLSVREIDDIRPIPSPTPLHRQDTHDDNHKIYHKVGYLIWVSSPTSKYKGNKPPHMLVKHRNTIYEIPLPSLEKEVLDTFRVFSTIHFNTLINNLPDNAPTNKDPFKGSDPLLISQDPSDNHYIFPEDRSFIYGHFVGFSDRGGEVKSKVHLDKYFSVRFKKGAVPTHFLQIGMHVIVSTITYPTPPTSTYANAPTIDSIKPDPEQLSLTHDYSPTNRVLETLAQHHHFNYVIGDRHLNNAIPSFYTVDEHLLYTGEHNTDSIPIINQILLSSYHSTSPNSPRNYQHQLAPISTTSTYHTTTYKTLSSATHPRGTELKILIFTTDFHSIHPDEWPRIIADYYAQPAPPFRVESFTIAKVLDHATNNYNVISINSFIPPHNNDLPTYTNHLVSIHLIARYVSLSSMGPDSQWSDTKSYQRQKVCLLKYLPHTNISIPALHSAPPIPNSIGSSDSADGEKSQVVIVSFLYSDFQNNNHIATFLNSKGRKYERTSIKHNPTYLQFGIIPDPYANIDAHQLAQELSNPSPGNHFTPYLAIASERIQTSTPQHIQVNFLAKSNHHKLFETIGFFTNSLPIDNYTILLELPSNYTYHFLEQTLSQSNRDDIARGIKPSFRALCLHDRRTIWLMAHGYNEVLPMDYPGEAIVHVGGLTPETTSLTHIISILAFMGVVDPPSSETSWVTSEKGSPGTFFLKTSVPNYSIAAKIDNQFVDGQQLSLEPTVPTTHYSYVFTNDNKPNSQPTITKAVLDFQSAYQPSTLHSRSLLNPPPQPLLPRYNPKPNHHHPPKTYLTPTSTKTTLQTNLPTNRTSNAPPTPQPPLLTKTPLLPIPPQPKLH